MADLDIIAITLVVLCVVVVGLQIILVKTLPWRFSLRTLLIAMTVVAAVLGFISLLR